ncbi:MAG: PmoA family protein [Verrucomicrobiales bacterium]|nr:PmoA family protein [Verrucomicrobiales bacterium]
MKTVRFAICALAIATTGLSQEEWKPHRCELIPLPENQVEFRAEGELKTKWHFGGQYPRPFFYPFNGPSGVSLTRMGHPGAENHDHHRSIWFAHMDVAGENFWGDSGETQIRQKHWYAYRDGKEESIMATKLEYVGKAGDVLMIQDLVAASLPGKSGEHVLEIQITLRPPEGKESVELGKTNFGFLAVRVAKSLSHHFGGGQITNSEGAVGEKEIFGKSAKWVDYSGPVAVGTGEKREVVQEGITFFDHPDNPRYPTKWHVRSDGWMGASFCFDEGWEVTKENPLTLRYLLHAHSGRYDSGRCGEIAGNFAESNGFEIGKSDRPHRQYDVWRIKE